MAVRVAYFVLRFIETLRCSQPIKRKRLGDIRSNSSSCPLKQPAERVLAVFAAPPCARPRKFKR